MEENLSSYLNLLGYSTPGERFNAVSFSSPRHLCLTRIHPNHIWGLCSNHSQYQAFTQNITYMSCMKRNLAVHLGSTPLQMDVSRQEFHRQYECFLSQLCGAHICWLVLLHIVVQSHNFNKLSIQPVSFFYLRPVVGRVLNQFIWS